jgi:hypothetical protein
VVPFFALFHLPARFVAGWIRRRAHPGSARATTVALGYFVLAAVVAVLLRVLIMWIHSSGRSVIIVGLFHTSHYARKRPLIL